MIHKRGGGKPATSSFFPLASLPEDSNGSAFAGVIFAIYLLNFLIIYIVLVYIARIVSRNTPVKGADPGRNYQLCANCSNKVKITHFNQ